MLTLPSPKQHAGLDTAKTVYAIRILKEWCHEPSAHDAAHYRGVSQDLDSRLLHVAPGDHTHTCVQRTLIKP